MIKIIVATSKNRVIGKDNKLLWKQSEDLKRFKNLTQNSTVIMGRKTYESIGKPLPNRRNIIVTRSIDLDLEGCEVVNSISEALLLCNNDCFVIGGGEIYNQSLQVAEKVYLTLVNCEIDGDTSFPELDKTWTKVSRSDFKSDEKNEYDYSFIEYEKYRF